MEQLVERLESKLNLSGNTTINKILILDIEKKSVVYSLNLANPSQTALEAWKMWQSATALTEPNDAADDQLIHVKNGTQQIVMLNDPQYLFFASLDKKV